MNEARDTEVPEVKQLLMRHIAGKSWRFGPNRSLDGHGTECSECAVNSHFPRTSVLIGTRKFLFSRLAIHLAISVVLLTSSSELGTMTLDGFVIMQISSAGQK